MNKCWSVALALAALSWSCFEIDQELKLKKDLSGTAKLGMKADLQPMIVIMAAMARAFGGKEGPPTKAEIIAETQADAEKVMAANSRGMVAAVIMARSWAPRGPFLSPALNRLYSASSWPWMSASTH